MGLRERMLEGPGPKGRIVQEPEFQVGDKIKINPEMKDLALKVSDLTDIKAIYTVTNVYPYTFRSCRLSDNEEDECVNCKHFRECMEADDEIYANWIVSQMLTVSLSGISNKERIGSSWFVKS